MWNAIGFGDFIGLIDLVQIPLGFLVEWFSLFELLSQY